MYSYCYSEQKRASSSNIRYKKLSKSINILVNNDIICTRSQIYVFLGTTIPFYVSYFITTVTLSALTNVTNDRLNLSLLHNNKHQLNFRCITSVKCQLTDKQCILYFFQSKPSEPRKINNKPQSNKKII